MANLEGRAEIVIKNYNNARTRGDFLESLLAVHTVIGDATAQYLHKDESEEEDRIPFNKLISEAFEDYFRSHPIFDMDKIYELNRKRNHIAHPKRDITSGEVYDVTKSYFILLVELWPKLFSSALPIIQHPSGIIDQRNLVDQIENSQRQISSLQNTIRELQQSNQTLRNQQPQTGAKTNKTKSQIFASGGNLKQQLKSIRWRNLFFGLAWLLVVFGLAGFAVGTWLNPSANRWFVLIPGIGSVVALILSLRQFIRFIRAIRFRRLFVALSTGIILLTLLFIPFAPNYLAWDEKAAYAFGSVIEQTVRLPVNIVSGLYSLGVRLADLVNAAPEPQVLEQQDPSEPEPAAESSGQSIGTNSADKIEPGTTAEVVNIDTRLMCRQSPGRTEAIVARLESGDIVHIISDTVEEDNIMWLRVQFAEDRCWCAAEYLKVLE
ncbi:MAG: hypothetical protein ACK2U1_10125 [Anaerolineales bacterium]|jgi:hypothetical protein